jgi:hypothetical protein
MAVATALFLIVAGVNCTCSQFASQSHIMACTMRATKAPHTCLAS